MTGCFFSNFHFRFGISPKDSTNDVAAEMLTRSLADAWGIMGEGRAGMGTKGKGKERASDDFEPSGGMPIPPRVPGSTGRHNRRMDYVEIDVPVKREDISGDKMVSDSRASSTKLFK